MDQQRRWRAFRHGRLSTLAQCLAMSQMWAEEMDRFVMTRSPEEMERVRLYVAGKLHRISRGMH